jgi:hypothetical protein
MFADTKVVGGVFAAMMPLVKKYGEAHLAFGTNEAILEKLAAVLRVPFVIDDRAATELLAQVLSETGAEEGDLGFSLGLAVLISRLLKPRVLLSDLEIVHSLDFVLRPDAMTGDNYWVYVQVCRAIQAYLATVVSDRTKPPPQEVVEYAISFAQVAVQLAVKPALPTPEVQRAPTRTFSSLADQSVPRPTFFGPVQSGVKSTFSPAGAPSAAKPTFSFAQSQSGANPAFSFARAIDRGQSGATPALRPAGGPSVSASNLPPVMLHLVENFGFLPVDVQFTTPDLENSALRFARVVRKFAKHCGHLVGQSTSALVGQLKTVVIPDNWAAAGYLIRNSPEALAAELPGLIQMRLGTDNE